MKNIRYSLLLALLVSCKSTNQNEIDLSKRSDFRVI